MPEDMKTAKGGTEEDMSREDEEKASLETFEITMDKRADLAVSMGVALIGAFVLIATRGIRAGSIPDPITSRGMPNVVGVFLIIVGIVLAARQLLTWSELPGHLVPEEGQADEKGYPASWVRAISIILLSVVWNWLLRPLGFLIITPLYLLAALWCMNVRSWRKLIGFSIIFTVTTWGIFGPLLGVRFPLGPLDHLARSLGLIA